MTLEDVCYLIGKVLSDLHPSEHKSIALSILGELNESGAYIDPCGRGLLLDACEGEDILIELIDLLIK